MVDLLFFLYVIDLICRRRTQGAPRPQGKRQCQQVAGQIKFSLLVRLQRLQPKQQLIFQEKLKSGSSNQARSSAIIDDEDVPLFSFDDDRIIIKQCVQQRCNTTFCQEQAGALLRRQVFSLPGDDSRQEQLLRES